MVAARLGLLFAERIVKVSAHGVLHPLQRLLDGIICYQLVAGVDFMRMKEMLLPRELGHSADVFLDQL